VLNTSSNVGRIGFDGSTITGPNFVMGATYQRQQQHSRPEAVGSIGAVGTGNGEFTVTGTLERISAIRRSTRRSSTTR
jgi:hypothetical protein